MRVPPRSGATAPRTATSIQTHMGRRSRLACCCAEHDAVVGQRSRELPAKSGCSAVGLMDARMSEGQCWRQGKQGATSCGRAAAMPATFRSSSAAIGVPRRLGASQHVGVEAPGRPRCVSRRACSNIHRRARSRCRWSTSTVAPVPHPPTSIFTDECNNFSNQTASYRDLTVVGEIDEGAFCKN